MDASRIIDMHRAAAAEGLTDFAEFVRDQTRPRTPNDPSTGGDDLSGSLTVEPATESDLTAQVYTNAEHALYQHEALNIQHPTGEAKYLENTTLDSAGAGERIIGAAVRRRLG
jgi:hypothetical protein